MSLVRHIAALGALFFVMGSALWMQGCSQNPSPVPIAVFQGIAQGRTGDLIILKNGEYFGEHAQQVQRVAAMEGVGATSAFALGGAVIAKLDGKGRYVLLKGISLGTDFTMPTVDASVCSPLYAEAKSDTLCRIDDVFKGGHLPGIVMGRPLAKLLGVKPGDRVQLLDVGSAMAEQSRSEWVQVGALFETGFQSWDERMIYIALPLAQHLLGMGAAVTGIEVKLDDTTHPESVAGAISSELGPDYPVVNAQQLQGQDPWAQALPVKPARRTVARRRAPKRTTPVSEPKPVEPDEDMAIVAPPPRVAPTRPTRPTKKRRRRRKRKL